MMGKNNYQDWTKEDLIQEIKRLKKRKKYGLVWDEEKTKERFEADAEGKLPVLVEDKKKEIMTDDKNKFRLPAKEDKFSNPDNDPRGHWVADPFEAAGIGRCFGGKEI